MVSLQPTKAKETVRIVDQHSLLTDEPLMRGHRIDAKTRSLLTGDQAYATTWWVWLFDWYSDRPATLNDMLREWSPETIRYEIQAEMRIECTRRTMGRILAGRELLTGNSFYRRPWFFIHICQALWSGDLHPDRFVQLDDPAILAWGILESLALNEPDSIDEAWSAEVLGYTRDLLERSGLVSCPAAIKAAMPGVFEPDTAVDWSAMPTQDPDAMEAEFGGRQQATDDIDAEVSGRFQDLLKQIESLPLRAGSTAGLNRYRGG